MSLNCLQTQSHLLSFLMTMTSFSQVSSEMYSLLQPIFEKINLDNWNQARGDYFLISHPPKCCVGAHISKELDLEKYEDDYGEFYYCHLDSIFYLMKKFELKDDQLNAIFHCAGAPEFPFCTEPWDDLPSVVLENIKFIETCPPRFSEYLGEDYYERPEVKKWLELERNRIELCKRKELAIV